MQSSLATGSNPNALNKSTSGLLGLVERGEHVIGKECKFCLIEKGHFDVDGLKYLGGT